MLQKQQREKNRQTKIAQIRKLKSEMMLVEPRVTD